MRTEWQGVGTNMKTTQSSQAITLNGTLSAHMKGEEGNKATLCSITIRSAGALYPSGE